MFVCNGPFNFNFGNNPPVELVMTYLNFEFLDKGIIITILIVTLNYSALLRKETVVYSSNQKLLAQTTIKAIVFRKSYMLIWGLKWLFEWLFVLLPNIAT